MQTNGAIVRSESHAIESRATLEPQSMADARALAKIAVDSRFFAVKSEAEALVILMTGRDLGLSSMQALRGIYVVQGKPVLSADLMVAAVISSDKCEYWQSIESTPERCTIETKRRGARGPVRKTWTAEDARRAELTGKGTWKQYPAQMLRHRCAADLAREVYSDLLLGIYSPDEIDPNIPPVHTIIEQAPPPAPANTNSATTAAATTTEPVEQAFDAQEWLRWIAESDGDGLAALMEEIKKLPQKHRDTLREPWWLRRITLCPADGIETLRLAITKIPTSALKTACQKAWQARSDALHAGDSQPSGDADVIENEGA
jgi:hypothetical protein